MRHVIRTIVAIAALSGTSLALAPAAQAADDAHVSVLHAVPGAVVDVYANGEPLVTGCLVLSRP